MTSFADKFPELKEIRIEEDGLAWTDMSKSDDKGNSLGQELVMNDVCFSRLDIDKYCLNRSRVHKAIMRLPDDNRRYILLKELGLEETE